MRERLYTAKTDLGDNAAVPELSWCISINVTVLARQNTLRWKMPTDWELIVSIASITQKILRENPQSARKRNWFGDIRGSRARLRLPDDVDAQLYNGFFSDADRAAMKIVLETEPRNLPALDIAFVDKRIEKLLFSYPGAQLPGDAGLCRAATLAGAPPPRSSRQRFLRGCTDGLQMLAQQYADDYRESGAVKSALARVYAEEIVWFEASASGTAEDNVGQAF
ncbi:hypothetical protein O5478_18460 [Escherichia coli]|nr:hypothetical protein [Escherichia coli]